MENKSHDPKDPDAILHFAQELDSASGEDRPAEAEKPVNAVQKTRANEGIHPSKNEPGESKPGVEEEDDEPGLVARMTAKGALSGF